MKRFLFAVWGVLLSAPAFAEFVTADDPHPGILQTIAPDTLAVDFVYSFPFGNVPGQKPWPGLRLEYDFAGSPWGLELGYAYRGKQYYDYDGSWRGPLLWQQVDSGGVSESDWPFFQTRHVFSPGVLFRGRWLGLRPRVALDLLVQSYVAGGATRFYPDYQDSFQRYTKTTKVIFGSAVKTGIDGLLWSWLDYGVDLVLEIPDYTRCYEQVRFSLAAYAQTNLHLGACRA